MSNKFNKGDKVKWSWGNGTATGEVTDRYEEETTHTIKGKKITRKGSKDDPAYMVKQEDGDRALKLGSELSKG